MLQIIVLLLYHLFSALSLCKTGFWLDLKRLVMRSSVPENFDIDATTD